MPDLDLCYLSATEALARFRAGTLSPVELMEAVIDRAEAVEDRVNAFADTYFDEALAAAREAERRWRDGTARALEGIPVAIKDAQRIAGRRTTFGSLIFMDDVDRVTDPMVERLLAAGAICHARTTTPEFCLSGITHSRAWGVTRNPFNLDYTPGGSSGGSAAALAAGTTTLATGTDIGGSIRIPAGCCGIVGYKPPHGRNPHGFPACLDLYDHCGPMTRTVADAGLVQNLVSGPHPADFDSLRERVVVPVAAEPVGGLRVAWSMDLGYMHVDPEVRAATHAALDVLRGLGCVVEEVDLGWTRDTETAAGHWYNAMHFGRQTVWHARDKADLMTGYALAFARAAEARTTLDDAARSWETVHAMYARFAPIMERHDVFVCPTNALPAVPAEHDPAGAPLRIDGAEVDPENGWVLTYPFNMLHWCPVISVPSGRAASGVPTAIQIVGRTFDDAAVFRLALAYERAATGCFVTPAGHPL